MSIQETKLQAIANAIREKDGTTEPIPANDFPARIRAIKTGSSFAIPLVVTADVGTVITAVNGDTTVTGTIGDSGSVTLTLPSPGDWSVSAQLGDKTKGPEIVSVQDRYTSEFFMTSRLPVGYTEVEYIQTDDKAGIDTGVLVNLAKTKLYIDMEAGPYSTTKTQYIWGTKGNNTVFCFVLSRDSSTKISYKFGKVNFSLTATIDISNKRVNLAFSNGLFTIGESTIATVNSTDVASQNLLLGAPVSTYTSITAKIYSCQIYDGETIIRDFIPAINPSGITGLYDLVNEVFYRNAWSGTLAPGPAI